MPADPIDTAIGAVFTDPAIDTVIGWDTDGWRIAVRRDGVWESNQQYGALNEVRTKYGYWVKSNNFVRQPVALTGNDPRRRTENSDLDRHEARLELRRRHRPRWRPDRRRLR